MSSGRREEQLMVWWCEIGIALTELGLALRVSRSLSDWKCWGRWFCDGGEEVGVSMSNRMAG